VVEKVTRDAIARAGLRLLDAGGIGAITTRALAAELGVRSPTLYWHVKSKQEILRAMAVVMSNEAAAAVTAADRRAPWEQCLTSWAQALRTAMLSHPHGARVYAGSFAADPATFDVTESALQALQDAGVPPELAAQCTFLLRHFVVGFCIEEQALTELYNSVAPDRLNEMTAAADPTRFPLTAHALPAILDSDQEQRFQLAMRITLSGIATLITESRHTNQSR
jgi:TetR/AcrR family transcriptional regulator, tetracycline repressor protein